MSTANCTPPGHMDLPADIPRALDFLEFLIEAVNWIAYNQTHKLPPTYSELRQSVFLLYAITKDVALAWLRQSMKKKVHTGFIDRIAEAGDAEDINGLTEKLHSGFALYISEAGTPAPEVLTNYLKGFDLLRDIERAVKSCKQ